MAKYDDASWHYGGDYPAGLDHANAATHIGMFLSWCIHNNLISSFQLEESTEDVAQVKNRSITGADFLITHCDEKFTDEDLTDTGNAFAADYYGDDTAFAQQFGSYLADYAALFDAKYEAEKKDLPSIYHIENTWQNYDLLAPVLNKRFAEWKKFKHIHE